MKYKAVIFDLDGTLLDTIADISNTMNSVLRSHGWPEHGMDDYKLLVGEGLEVLIKNSLPADNRREDIIRECLLEYRREYADHWSDFTQIYDGIPALLNELKKRDITLGILSNKSDVFTQKMAAHYLSQWKFEVIRGSLPDVPNKPDPTSAITISRMMNIPPGECMFTGDSAIDMKTAVASGMFPLGVTWGFRSAEELLNAGARALISHPLELLDMC